LDTHFHANAFLGRFIGFARANVGDLGVKRIRNGTQRILVDIDTPSAQAHEEKRFNRLRLAVFNPASYWHLKATCTKGYRSHKNVRLQCTLRHGFLVPPVFSFRDNPVQLPANLKIRVTRWTPTRVRDTIANPAYCVANVCGKCDLHVASLHGLDLRSLSTVAEFNAVYSPTFAAVQLFFYDPMYSCHVVCLVFKSGIINIVGTKSVARLHYWFEYVKKRIDAHFVYGYTQAPTHTVTNVAGAASLNEPFDVERFLACTQAPKDCHYAPNVFSGMSMRLNDAERWPGENIVVNAFKNSLRFCITGAKSEASGRAAAALFRAHVAASIASDEARGNSDVEQEPVADAATQRLSNAGRAARERRLALGARTVPSKSRRRTKMMFID